MRKLSILNERKKTLFLKEVIAKLSPEERFNRFLDLLMFIENVHLPRRTKKIKIEIREKQQKQKRQAFIKFLRKFHE